MTKTSAAMAVLDTGDRADEDSEMESEMQMLRREVGEGFAGVNARIDELRRETTERIDRLRQETTDRILEERRDTNARIDALHRETLARIDQSRKEASDNSASLNARMFDFHRETTARIDAVLAESHKRMDRSDVQFRWLVGLMITSLLATAGLFARAAHML
ncbi:hypothetical protein NHH73_24090 [Oxalobacteraceae bacterium OTU3CINTB1]|nr:hypothetical protein NHH73_24090 [Oxalobacteraceae bacterium OTU3CINTB1]